MTWFNEANCIGFDLVENIELGRRKWNAMYRAYSEWIESLASSIRHMRDKPNTTREVRYKTPNFFLMDDSPN